METQSIDRLRQLHPAVKEKALDAYAEAVRITPKGVHPYILETLRSFTRSDELFAQGRTKPGDIVTDARAGQSYHNYGLALDFANQINGSVVWKVDANWMKVVNAFKKRGFLWGGDWKKSNDSPHLEMRFGFDWRELLYRHNDGYVDKKGYVILCKL